MKNSPLAIIGAGHIGSALAKVFQKQKVACRVWDIKMKGGPDFTEVVSGTQMIFLCIPSWAHRETARSIAAVEPKQRRVIVTLAKGMDPDRAETMDQILRAELPRATAIGVLAGPMLAAEITAGRFSTGVIGLKDARWRAPLARLFSGTPLRVSFSTDLRGVAVCSVLKNIYAVGLGIADGLVLGANAKSFYTVVAYQEMRAIVRRLGGRASTVEGPAGLGDLLATGWSDLSYNHRVGQEIVRGAKCPRSEGCVALPAVTRLLGKKMSEFPILSTLKKIVIDQHHAKDIFPALF